MQRNNKITLSDNIETLLPKKQIGQLIEQWIFNKAKTEMCQNFYSNNFGTNKSDNHDT